MKLLFFASFREKLGTDCEQWPNLDGIETLNDLLESLRSRGEPWLSTLASDSVLAAVNQEIAALNTSITLDDEVALFPPVTGG